MDIEEAKKILEELKKNEWGELLNCWDYGEKESKAIETVLKELELKDKVIDEMADWLQMIAGNTNALDTFFDIPLQGYIYKTFRTKESIIEYFTNKVKLQSIKQSQ